MCGDKYNIKVICNCDTPSSLRFRMPTSPMDRNMESFNGRCMYRILSVVRDSSEAGLDNKALIIEFRIPTQNCYIKTIGTPADPSDCRESQLQFLIPLQEGSVSEDWMSNKDPVMLGNNAWGNMVEVIFKTIDKGTGVIALFEPDMVIAFELEVEPYDDMYEKMKRQKEIGM